jgi:hypothetical protein
LGKIENAFIRLGMHKMGLKLSIILTRLSKYGEEQPATKALGSPHYGYAGRVGTKKHRKQLKKERKA